jgi:2-polyprenyl-6-methoxyphenol hydroxylase-like FAD-dependent oxidoreductase
MIMVTWNIDETEDHAALARDGDLLLDKVRAMAEPLAYPFKAMVRDIPRGTKTWYRNRMSYWPTTPWDSRGGRVTLTGDAAHAMTFRKSQVLTCLSLPVSFPVLTPTARIQIVVEV